MTQEFETWQLDAIAHANTKTAIFTPAEKDKLKLDYPEKLLAVVPRFLVTDNEMEQFKIHADALIAALPETTNLIKANISTYAVLIADSRAMYSAKYNLVKNGANAGRWFFVGFFAGMGFGLIFKKIGIGLPFGMVIGLMIGSGLDKKAAAEGRVL